MRSVGDLPWLYRGSAGPRGEKPGVCRRVFPQRKTAPGGEGGGGQAQGRSHLCKTLHMVIGKGEATGATKETIRHGGKC